MSKLVFSRKANLLDVEYLTRTLMDDSIWFYEESVPSNYESTK